VLFDASILDDTNRRLESCKQQVKSIEMKKTEAIVGLNKSKQKAEMIIDRVKGELIANVEKLTKEAKEDVENEFQSAKAQIDVERQEANKTLDDLEQVSSELENTERNKSQQFVCMKKATQKIKEIKVSELVLTCNREAKISFDADSSIQGFVHDTKKLGNVQSIQETSHYTVETIEDINVKLQNDKSTCDIFGSCMTEDGSLLLTDINNKKLKQVNIETMTVDSACSFKNNPFCVCCTNKDEVVVTFFTYAKFIQFVSVGTRLAPSRKVNINHNCLGISYKDEKLFITDNDHSIYVHDMSGKELQKIMTDNSGNGLFSCVQEIDLSDSMRGIVVVDGKKGIIILNNTYRRIAGYCGPELHNAVSACTDGCGSIFVCGYSSHNILQVGYDGKKIGDVVEKSHGIQNLSSLCFDFKRCRLFATQNNDIVKIIHLM
jgi:hypothetical protein